MEEAFTRSNNRRSHLGKGHVGMGLRLFERDELACAHLAWLLPTDGLRDAASELLPGDLLVNAAGYVYYVARSGAFLACGHLAEPACYRRALLHLKREECWLFDIAAAQQAALAQVIARLARKWICSHEQQAVYASFDQAACAWRRSFSECPCDDVFCVCLYRFPCPECGTLFTALGGLMQEVVERVGRCPRCTGTAPLAQV